MFVNFIRSYFNTFMQDYCLLLRCSDVFQVEMLEYVLRMVAGQEPGKEEDGRARTRTGDRAC